MSLVAGPKEFGVLRNPKGSLGRSLNHHPLDLIEAHFVVPTIVKLRGARAGVVRHRGSFFERTAVLEIGGDARGAEGVIADFRLDAGRRRAPPDHGIGVRLR